MINKDFSVKHELCGFKTGFSERLNGISTEPSGKYGGSVSEINIMIQIVKNKIEGLQEIEEEVAQDDLSVLNKTYNHISGGQAISRCSRVSASYYDK